MNGSEDLLEDISSPKLSELEVLDRFDLAWESIFARVSYYDACFATYLVGMILNVNTAKRVCM